jgi:hypothetical protein
VLSAPPGHCIFDQLVEVPKVVKHDQCFLKTWSRANIEPTWDCFMDVVKEKYYPMGKYDDQYMIWTMLHQNQDQKVSKFTNNFHTFCTNLGIKDI